jgi:hypothetical protein
MHHSSDMDDPGEGSPFYQCEQCGEIIEDTGATTEI